MKLQLLLLTAAVCKCAHSDTNDDLVEYYTNLINEWQEAAYHYALPEDASVYEGDESTVYGIASCINW